MKITIIGGGSTYTPEVMEGLIGKAEDLDIKEVVLVDIDPSRLDVVGSFCARMAKHAGALFKVTSTQDRRKAVDGADFVLTQFRVGGQAARWEDEKLGLRHGLIGQETTGIGGMAKALRTIPVIMDICADIEKTAPSAWIINFTNPSGIITQTILNHTRCKCIGLCNVPLEMKMTIAALQGVEDKDVRMETVGLNHLGWIRRIIVKGEDKTREMLDFCVSADGPANIPDIAFPPELITSLGAVPLYYDRYYYNTQSILAELRAKPKTRAQEVMAIEEALLAKYRDPNVVEKPPELSKRGGAFYSKIAVDIIHSISKDTGDEHVVNVRNGGAMPDLADSATVEINSVVDKRGAHPIPTDPMEPSMRALIQRAKAYEELTIEAALLKSRSAAFRAIITNPLGPLAEHASKVLDDLLLTNRLDYK
jgi:6-phospho-beta-glucosidase